MKSLLPLVIVILVLVALTVMARRNRQRVADAQQARADAIQVGAEVMTTSGLFGTVVRRDEDTVQLEIAPGVEVKWALAALRDPQELPVRRTA
ncbi:MAG: preprotein translocase subunit YajC [Jatrophihabitans sp.]|uniref:preprotein translocase subunit YajC n=1 Tax=Jatrophihabitans sp. TaxID=1932789 RepID=UPI003F81FFCE